LVVGNEEFGSSHNIIEEDHPVVVVGEGAV
jgi:hypothetical protein